MAFKTLSAVASGHQPAVTPSGSELVAGRFSQSIALADHAAGTKGVIGVLPAGCVPVMAFVRAGALGAGFKASFGVGAASGALSTAAEDGGAAWIVDDTTGAAGGYTQKVSGAMAAVAPVDYDRKLVLEITAAGTAAGVIAVDVIYAYP